MQQLFISSYNIISPLGATGKENFDKLQNGISGVTQHQRTDIDEDPFWASLISDEQMKRYCVEISGKEKYTRFEKLLIASISDAAKNSAINISDTKTVFIFSTTKGNISLLDDETVSEDDERLTLFYSAKKITNYFQNTSKPFVISNACISGSMAILFAQRLLETGQFDNAVVAGADTISKFVFSGFKSFQALSPQRCQPFSLNRDGINLGEAAATLILTKNESDKNLNVVFSGGAITNDANHISGPSRTGEELSNAINQAVYVSGISENEIGFISAHGTATLFNDEMEANAFHRSKLDATPVNSLKGYFGHTLGASGILESVISIISLQKNTVIASAGFIEIGVTQLVNVCTQNLKTNSDHLLKTASGFGGCNAALIFSKY